MANYFNISLSSIGLVQDIVACTEAIKLHEFQCTYLAEHLLGTRKFLQDHKDSLDSAKGNRWKALLELYSVVKRAETLVQKCCCLDSPWLKASITLAEIKAEVVDIVLHLQWWTSVLNITISAVKGESSSQEAEVVQADREFESLLLSLHTEGNALDAAASEDKKILLKKLARVCAGRNGRRSDDEDYILSVYLLSFLRNSGLNSQEAGIPTLNQYQTHGLLGQGSFGTVLEVTWLGCRCALKVLKCKDEKEATELSRCQHPHVVQFFRYWEAPSPSDPPDSPPQSHILMELMPTDLSKLIVAQSTGQSSPASSRRTVEESCTPKPAMPFLLPVAIDVMLQVAKAMWHLHSNNMVHRDLKTANILVSRVSESVPELLHEGYLYVKLGDFGLARVHNGSSTSSPLARVGSSVYAAPEVFYQENTGVRALPMKADVWSFAMTCSEILCGQVPFTGEPREDLHARMKTFGIRPPLPDECPEYLRFCIASCWQLQPEERPQFSDIWRMLRYAKLLSLGLIEFRISYFTYTARNGGVKRMEKEQPMKIPQPMENMQRRVDHEPQPAVTIPSRTLIQGILLRMHKAVQFILRLRRNSRTGHVSDVSLRNSGRTSIIPNPTLYSVNQVWPPEELPDPTDTTLDIIFFEGNVGISPRDTWAQRGNPHVCWPQHWLHKDLGNNIRVLLLYYCISDGFEKVVKDLLNFLVFSDRWSRGGWKRPIVLVGHSLGGIVIKHLVVDLYQKAHSNSVRASISRAFLESLQGCFFYSLPHGGMKTSKRLMGHVFRGLTYSEALFADLSLRSEVLEKLSRDFVNAGQFKLEAIIEGKHTVGELVVPSSSMQTFNGSYSELTDSDHSEVCKPADKLHPSYVLIRSFLNSIQERLETTTGSTNGQQ